MKYRAVIKQVDDWWIGWLVDLPGVNAQEKSRSALVESLKIGAEDMLATQILFEPDSTIVVVEVPSPEWSLTSA